MVSPPKILLVETPAEPQPAEPQLAEPQLAEPQLVELQLVELQLVELEVAELEVGIQPELQPETQLVDLLGAALGRPAEGWADNWILEFKQFVH